MHPHLRLVRDEAAPAPALESEPVPQIVYVVVPAPPSFAWMLGCALGALVGSVLVALLFG